MKCNWCREDMFKGEWVIHNGKYYHPDCEKKEGTIKKYSIEKSDKCNYCKKPFNPGNWEVAYQGKQYHADCRDILVQENTPQEPVLEKTEIQVKAKGPTAGEVLKHIAKEGAISAINLASKTSDTTKNIFREAAIRSGKYEKIETEEDAYAIAYEEIETKKFRKGLMAKAMALSGGSKKKQEAKYIELRAQQLIDIAKDLGK